MLQPSEYFARYGKHLEEGVKAESAWIATEREFYILYGFRRFRTFASFQDAHAAFRAGHRVTRIILHVCTTFSV